MSVARLTAARRVSSASIGSLHAEAMDWHSRVVTNGGSVSSSTLLAVSAFCRAIDAAGIRDRFLRLNLVCGTGLSAALVPLYRAASLGASALGSTTDTNNGPFVSGDYAETGSTGGLKGNGTSKYLATGFGTNLLGSLSDMHIAFSATALETATTTSGVLHIGTDTTGGNSVCDIGLLNYPSSTRSRAMRLFSGTNYPFQPSSGLEMASARGSEEPLMVATRTANNVATLYGSGAQIAQDTVTRSPASTTNGIFVCATNGNGSPGAYSSMRLRCYSIGNGLTAAQVRAYTAAIVAFNTALDRA